MDEHDDLARTSEGKRLDIQRQREWTALVARVEALERQVAELRQADEPRALRSTACPPPPREEHATKQAEEPTEPPPVARAAAPGTVILSGKSLEDRLGSQVFNLIGIVALLFGTAWFLKLAIEHGWIAPLGRVLIGLAAGGGLILWSELFRRRQLAAFSYSLKALGSGVLYLSLWAAFQLYHLFPAVIALVAMVLVTAWIAFMAWSQDSELLAAYALAGGLATPLLLSTGGDHEGFLFTYLAMIDFATVLLLRFKRWPRLLVPAFLATPAYFIGWYITYFHRNAQNATDGQFWETACFVLIFFAIFELVTSTGWTPDDTAVSDQKPGRRGGVLASILIPLANAAFVALALYSVFEDSGFHVWLAWLMVALAGVSLGLMRVQQTRLSGTMHLAAAVVLLTVAIPLKASGHSLTIAWLVEGLVLFWASLRVNASPGIAEDAHADGSALILRLLSAGGYGLGLASLAIHWLWVGSDPAPAFFSADLASALVAVATLTAAFAFANGQSNQATRQPLLAAMAATGLVGLLLASREIADLGFFERPSARDAFLNADFATAVVGLAVLAEAAGGSWWAASKTVGPANPGRRVAGALLVLFNLVAILSVEREISSLWSRSDADVQRSLAISGFLVAYGAALLAAGFWRRIAFVRWQALILLTFTIAKVFVYDVSGLSAGYRVASFLGLGAVLMAISFAYQKDWLGLRPTPDLRKPAAAGDEQ